MLVVLNAALISPATFWLPAPEGGFYIIVRLYAPTEAGVAGEWTPPPVVQVSQ